MESDGKESAAALLGGLLVVSMAASFGIYHTTHLTWPSWVLAVLVALGVVALGRRFDTALRAQLRAGA